MPKFRIDKRFTSKVKRTDRVLAVAEAFGLGLKDKEFVVYDNLELEIHDGDVVYINGQSGSGKSLLLRELADLYVQCTYNVVNIDEVELLDKPLIDQIGKDINQAIYLLGVAGLNDAYLFVRKPSELSDGQRYRFRLAKLIESESNVWVADEFGATLDRITARVVAYNLQKIARKQGVTLIVATTHMDLKEDLNPDVVIDKFYREQLNITTDRRGRVVVGGALYGE